MSVKGSDPEVVRAYLGSSISIEGLHAAYGAVRVLEDVSTSVASGETVVLLGTNGNGKSTLMKCGLGSRKFPWLCGISA